MNTRRGRWLVALVLGASMMGRAARADDWSSLGLDGMRSRFSGERSGAVFGPAKWEHSLPPVRDAVYHTLLASPAAADGVLVYGTYDNFIRGLRADDGQPLWELRTRDAVHASPALWRGGPGARAGGLLAGGTAGRAGVRSPGRGSR
jgi:hypothetical protein